MEAPSLGDQVEARLRAVGTRHRAEGEKRYLKSDLEFARGRKRHPHEVVAWWRHGRIGASGVTMREAVKYLPPQDRERLMRAYREKQPAEH